MKESAIMGGFGGADTRDVAPPAARHDREASPLSSVSRDGRWAMLPDPLPAQSYQGRFEKLRTPRGSSADEAYEMLRTQILLLMLRGGYRTLAVTSPTSGAGSTTVAANVAVAMSRELDFTTILVDANLRHPSLRRMLDLPPGPGLANYLADTAEPEEVMVQMEGRRLVILPGGEPLHSGAELLRSAMMLELVRGLSDARRDRLIVFDLPPVLEGPDMLAFSPHVDAVLLVIEEGVTTQEELERAQEILAEANVLGIVPNKSREASRLRRRRGRRKAGSGRRAHEKQMLKPRFNETSPPPEKAPAELVRTTNSSLKRQSRRVLICIASLAALAGLGMLAFAEVWPPPDRVAELVAKLGDWVPDRGADLFSELSYRVADLSAKLSGRVSELLLELGQ